MRLVQYFLGLGFASLLFSCNTSATATTAIARPQLVAVDPQDFLGTVPCSYTPPDGGTSDGGTPVRATEPGKLYSYVATLFDVTPPEDGGPPADPGFQLPSSPATPCTVPVTFSYVIGNHRYRAEVDGYDRDPRLDASDAGPTGIHAIGDTDLRLSGARIQVDENNARVTPLWTANCGGYPATPAYPPPDAGTSTGTDADAGTDAGVDAGTLGVVAYGALTQTVHDCGSGFMPVKSGN